MRWVRWLFNAILLLFWGGLLTNLVMPFPGKAAGTFHLLLVVMLATRGLQFLMLWAAYGKYLRMKANDVLLLILFGVAGLDSLRKRLDAKQIEDFKRIQAERDTQGGKRQASSGKQTSGLS